MWKQRQGRGECRTKPEEDFSNHRGTQMDTDRAGRASRLTPGSEWMLSGSRHVVDRGKETPPHPTFDHPLPIRSGRGEGLRQSSLFQGNSKPAPPHWLPFRDGARRDPCLHPSGSLCGFPRMPHRRRTPDGRLSCEQAWPSGSGPPSPTPDRREPVAQPSPGSARRCRAV
jgi:hypothetical protein